MASSPDYLNKIMLIAKIAMDYILVERLGEVCYNNILAIIAISYLSY